MSEKPFPTKYRINGRTYKPHPAANCFPLLAGTPYRDLVDDIRINGMTLPVLLLGDYVLDGRSRLIAAEELNLQRVPLTELPEDTDAVALVASLNIHRRHLTNQQRTLAAARLLALSQAAYRANYPDEPDPDDLASPLFDEDPPAAPLPAPAAAGVAAASAAPTRQASPSVAPRAAASNGGVVQPQPAGPAAAPASDSSAPEPSVAPGSGAPLPPGIGPVVDLTADGSPALSVRKVAAAYEASGVSVHRARQLIEKAPDLSQPLTARVITLNDAYRIQFEPQAVRRQAVEDVAEGRAATAVRAIRQRYGRDPVPDPDAPPDPSDAQPAPAGEPPPGEIAAAPAVLAFVRKAVGQIDFDPCSADWCAEPVGAAEWRGVDDDGLSVEWQGRVWVFPPPELADPFISKTLLELEVGRITSAALLVPMAP